MAMGRDIRSLNGDVADYSRGPGLLLVLHIIFGDGTGGRGRNGWGVRGTTSPNVREGELMVWGWAAVHRQRTSWTRVVIRHGVLSQVFLISETQGTARKTKHPRKAETNARRQKQMQAKQQRLRRKKKKKTDHEDT